MKALNAVAGRLQFAAFDRALLEVIGRARGLPVTFRHATRPDPGGDAGACVAWSEVTVEIAPAPLLLELRPQTVRELRLLDDGQAVDLRFRDLPFDRLYIVEGAPEVVVRELLDAALRRRLVDGAPLLLRCDGPEVTVARADWFIEPDEALALLDLALDVAQAVPGAVRRAERIEAPSGDPYRSLPDDAPARKARIAELAALIAMRSRRG